MQAAAGIDAEDESDAGGKLYRKATQMLTKGKGAGGGGGGLTEEVEAEARAMMAEAATLMSAEQQQQQGGHSGGALSEAVRLKMAEAAARGALDLSGQRLVVL